MERCQPHAFAVTEGHTHPVIIAGGVGGLAGDPAARHAGSGHRHRFARETIEVQGNGRHHVTTTASRSLPMQGLATSKSMRSNLADTDRYWDTIGEIIAPLGHVGLIVEPGGLLKIGDPYKAKSVGIHWEMMFARARFRTPDMIEQHRLLNRVASLIDAGELRTTHTETIGPINAANLREVHRRLESGSTIGKLVLAGWKLVSQP